MREAGFAEQAEAIAVRPDLRREIATAELMWRWVDYLADGYGIDPEATSVLDSTEISIVQVADPDGYFFGNFVIAGAQTAPEDGVRLCNLAAKIAPATSGTSLGTVGYPTSGTSIDRAYRSLGVAALVMEIGLRAADRAGFFPEYSCVDRLLWPQVGQVFTAAAGAAAALYRQ
ncbi:M14 family zinc carboxypeptidase [Nocardia sp. NPDC004604]|uniref:M14 family zinc carboxypeptidase n=1 Tax=Nocardia sp. NPDC004604 TaxID=3157013 RepID=UPI0033A69A96